MRKPIRPELSAIKISGIRRFNSEISDIDGILKLTLGEPDFDTPEHVKQAAINAINDNFTNYTNNAGTPELVSAAADYFNEKYQLGFTSEEVIVTIGATEAIAIALETILNPGDEVILPDPIYPGYEPLIHLMGAIPVKVDTTESAFKLTPAQLKSALSQKTKALILPYPSNPTGVTLSEAELRELADVLEGTGIYVLADEIYSELTYDKPHTSIRPMLKEQTIVINGLSKSHAMIGFRIGFLMAPKPLLQEMLKIHQYTVTCASSISQKAAFQAVTKGKNDAFQMRSEYKTRAGFVHDRLVKMGFHVIPPDGAFYFFVKLPDFVTESAYDFALKLAKVAKVAVVPGDAFSEKGDRYFRLSYAASLNTLTAATENMAKFMSEEYGENV